MPHESLGDFLSILQDAGELVRIAVPVDSALEIAEITRRVNRDPDGGPALFFESVRGSSLPVVTNLLGNRSRLCRALGVRSLDDLSARLTSASPAEPAAGWLDAFKLSPFGIKAASFAPRVIKQAPCQQIVKLGRDVNLWELPIPRSWPDEPQPVITLGQVITRCPQTQRRSVELIPVQVLDQQRLALGWLAQSAGGRHWKQACAANQQLPVAIALGGHAASPLMGLATLPDAMDPILFGGLLQGSSLEIAKCRTSELEIPAQAEIVIEGMLDPATTAQPAPAFALPTGFYSCRSNAAPVLQVTAVTHRANPIFPAQIFGAPPSEDSWMRLALERLMLPWIQSQIPEIVDYHGPVFGGGRSWLFVSIRQTEPMQARTVLHALWGHPLTRRIKGIVIVDDDVNVQVADEVWFAVGNHLDPGRDVIIASGPIDEDDHAGAVAGVGEKFGLDATRKSAEPRQSRVWPRELKMSEMMRQHVTDRWLDYGIPGVTEAAR